MHFKFDNPVFEFIGTTVDFVLLNAVFLLTCLPVFTIGTAVTALYTITIREARNEGDFPVKSYFAAFRDNFRSTTPVFLILLAGAAVLLFGIDFWLSMPDVIANIMGGILCIILLGIVLTAEYVFPLMSHFENTRRQSLSNARAMVYTHPLYTAGLAGIDALAAAACWFLSPARILMLLIGCSFTVYCKSFLLSHLFRRYEPEECTDAAG